MSGRGQYVRTPEFRDEQRRARLYSAAKVHFYAAMQDGAPADELQEILVRLQGLSPPAERGRWNKWAEVVARPGCQIRIGVFPAEVFLDEELPLAGIALDLPHETHELAEALSAND